MELTEVLSFDDVILVPKHSSITSRKDVDCSVELKTFGDNRFKLRVPIVSAPMDTICEAEMTFRLHSFGGLGIIHRYNTITEQIAIVKAAQNKFYQECCPHYPENVKYMNFGAAIGVNGDYIERAQELIKNHAKVICIDVAHGHHQNVITALEHLEHRINFNDVHIMVGNVAGWEGFSYLHEWANSIRVGIANGAVCSTYTQTGFGYPTLQGVMDVNSHRAFFEKPTQICADSGIRNSGDIVKSLAAGADFVMLGSLLAGTKAAPGEIVKDREGRWFKQYRGMASAAAQKARGQTKIREEGVSALVPYKGKVEIILESLEDGIRSGISYNGSTTIQELRMTADFRRLTQAGHAQGIPHVNR